MILLFFSAMLTAAAIRPGCDESPARLVCIERKHAYDIGDYEHMFQLLDRETKEVRRSLVTTSKKPPRPGSLRPLCLPLDAGFNVASERLHEPQKALLYLDRYAQAGCLRDPFMRPLYFTNRAMHARRQLDDASALELLQRGEAAAWWAWWMHWRMPSRSHLLWSIANSMATRAEIAASLRRPKALEQLVAHTEVLLGGIQAPPLASSIADIRNLLGWSLLMANEAGLPVEDPKSLLMAALQHFTEERPNAVKANNTRINLALAALQGQRLDECQQWIEQVDIPQLSSEGLMWLRLVQIRAALALDRPADTESWQTELNMISLEGRVPLAAWFAHSSEGRRQEAMGHQNTAISAYEAAEAILESYAHSRLDAAKASLAARRHLTFAGPTRRLVSLLVDTGADNRALAVVRLARSRAQRMAAAQHCSDAALLRDRPPDPHMLRLVYFQVGLERATKMSAWIGFAVTERTLQVESFELPSVPPDLYRYTDVKLAPWSAALLDPFQEQIDAANSIEILATGPLHGIPFHALPWEGDPLIYSVAVQNGHDLTPCRDHVNTLTGPALVLHGDEPALQHEANAVLQALQHSHRRARRIHPNSPGDLSPLLSGDYSIIHIAAHGTRTARQDLLESDDRLHFRGPLELSREAILNAQGAPELVYLSACQSSFEDAETLGGGVSLAHAFLLRGARYVVGAVGDIDGQVAETFAVAFYRALADNPLSEVPEAWRMAYIETHRALPPSLEPHLQMLRLFAH